MSVGAHDACLQVAGFDVPGKVRLPHRLHATPRSFTAYGHRTSFARWDPAPYDPGGQNMSAVGGGGRGVGGLLGTGHKTQVGDRRHGNGANGLAMARAFQHGHDRGVDLDRGDVHVVGERIQQLIG